jgi:hypothetical protein
MRRPRGSAKQGAVPKSFGPPPEAVLEAVRQRSGLSIDDEGRFCVHGERITHARTLEALWGSLERRPDGRYMVHVGRESAYVEVPFAPFAVRGLVPGPVGLDLLLSDGSREPLRPETLRVGRDGVLRTTVKGGEPARFTREAQVTLGLRLEEDRAAPGGYRLHLGPRSWPVGAE